VGVHALVPYPEGLTEAVHRDPVPKARTGLTTMEAALADGPPGLVPGSGAPCGSRPLPRAESGPRAAGIGFPARSRPIILPGFRRPQSPMKPCPLALEPVLRARSVEGAREVVACLCLLPLTLLGLAGCASTARVPRESVPVSVSAANYSRLSGEELYARAHDPVNARAEAPAVPKPAKPLYYLPLPGEVYPSDVPLDAIYRELEMALEPRGYFNADYQTKAGHTPPGVDYLLRVHYGERLWLDPTVRRDRVTWGNDGLVADRFKVNLISDPVYDPRIGLSQAEIANLHRLFGFAAGGAGASTLPNENGKQSDIHSYRTDERLWHDFGQEAQASSRFYLVVVEAFRFDDVVAMDARAPCVWATFVAVPVDQGLKFSNVLRAMLQTATPYFGETTHGRQLYEVPPGNVLVGTPAEVAGPQNAPQSTRQTPQ